MTSAASSTASRQAAGPPGRLAPVIDAVLRAYAAVFFAGDRRTGLLLLLATCIEPRHGFIGLCGTLLALGGVHLFGFDREAARRGDLLFNPLLSSLGLAHLCGLYAPGPAAQVILLVAVSWLTLFVSVAMGQAMARLHGLPCLSLPFVVASIPLFIFFPVIARYPPPAEAAWLLVPRPGFLSDEARVFLESFGAIFFMPHAAAGALVLLALVWRSRLVAFFAIAGYVGGSALVQGLGVQELAAFRNVFLGFNFVACGIALGCVFFIPSWGSLLLAVIGAFFSALIGLAAKSLLEPHGVPALAIPFNVAVLLALAALRHRTVTSFIPANVHGLARPEDDLLAQRSLRARFPDPHLPALAPPFYGERVVTQGFSGPVTHREQWQYALDFEVLDAGGTRFAGSGTRLEEFHTFNTPVLSPGDGTVVRVVDQVDDNAPGRNNLDDNWGNHVVLLLDLGGHALLSHFRKAGILVVPGQRVARGAILGYCGNSGRSPVPHLHMHFQHPAEPGAATVPFRLTHYVREGAVREYVFRGLPAQDERIKAAEFDDRLARCFEHLESCRWRYRVTRDGGSAEETITGATLGNGTYVLRSLTRKATLTARVADRVFCVLDFQGDVDSVLFAFQLGLSRVPFTGEQRAVWRDRLPARPLIHPMLRALRDLVLPFARTPFLELTGRIVGRAAWAGLDNAFVVATEVAPRRHGLLRQHLQRIEVALSETEGFVGARIIAAEGEVHAERIL